MPESFTSFPWFLQTSKRLTSGWRNAVNVYYWARTASEIKMGLQENYLKFKNVHTNLNKMNLFAL